MIPFTLTHVRARACFAASVIDYLLLV